MLSINLYHCGHFQWMTNWYFSYFSQKTGFDISCKLSPKETICMKCQTLFSGENKKNISKCRLLKFVPSMLSIEVFYAIFLKKCMTFLWGKSEQKCAALFPGIEKYYILSTKKYFFFFRKYICSKVWHFKLIFSEKCQPPPFFFFSKKNKTNTISLSLLNLSREYWKVKYLKSVS